MQGLFGLVPFLWQTVKIMGWSWNDAIWRIKLLRMIDLRRHRFERFSEFVSLYELYFHKFDSETWYKLFFPYQSYLTKYALPSLNLFHKVKVLRGVEDGMWLIKYMRCGAKEIHYFCGIDGRTSHRGSLHRIPGSKSYVVRSSGFSRKDFDVRVPKTWDVGIIRSLTAEDAAELYKHTGTDKSWAHFRMIHNFSTTLFNFCAEGDD